MSEWALTYEGFVPEQEGLREALCTLGNGVFATRGAAPETGADDVHYPGTYAAGVYDRLETHIAGRAVTNEDLVNLPNWLPLTFRPGGGDWLDIRRVDVLEHRQELNLRTGVLLRSFRYRDGAGRITGVTQRRFVSMADPELAALETTIAAENWSGTLEIRGENRLNRVNDDCSGIQAIYFVKDVFQIRFGQQVKIIGRNPESLAT